MENPTFKAFESCLQIAHFRHLQLELQDLLLVLIMLLTNQSHCLNHSKVFKKTSVMIWYVLINASSYVFFDDITNRIQYRKEKTSTLRPSKEPGGWALLYKTALYWPKGLSSLAWALLEILWKSEIHPLSISSTECMASGLIEFGRMGVVPLSQPDPYREKRKSSLTSHLPMWAPSGGSGMRVWALQSSPVAAKLESKHTKLGSI